MFDTCFPAGFYHIASLGAKDHIVFIAALCGMYTLRQWRHLLGLITVFSIGHTTSLTLTAMKVVQPPLDVIEFLIPLTIFLTALQNISTRDIRRMSRPFSMWKYLFTFLFGLIHGVGFGSESDFSNCAMGADHLFRPLVFFTMGIEVGQLLVLAIMLLIARAAITLFFFRQSEWNIFLSGLAAGIAILLMIEKAWWLAPAAG